MFYWIQLVRMIGAVFYPLEKFASWSKLCANIGESYPHWSGVSIFFPPREATSYGEGRCFFLRVVELPRKETLFPV